LTAKRGKSPGWGAIIDTDNRGGFWGLQKLQMSIWGIFFDRIPAGVHFIKHDIQGEFFKCAEILPTSYGVVGQRKKLKAI
jgi:hypothetical protein